MTTSFVPSHSRHTLAPPQVAPVVSNAPINAVVFGAERAIMRHMRAYEDRWSLDPRLQHMVAGV